MDGTKALGQDVLCFCLNIEHSNVKVLDKLPHYVKKLSKNILTTTCLIIVVSEKDPNILT